MALEEQLRERYEVTMPWEASDAYSEAKEAARRKRNLARVRYERAIKVWDGTYGAYHDSLFCGLSCAYRYALRAARREELE